MKIQYLFIILVSFLLIVASCKKINIQKPDPDPIPPEEQVFQSGFRTAAEVNRALGKGVNIDNALEMPNKYGGIERFFKSDYGESFFKSIAQKGFNHVRIPISWEFPYRGYKTFPYVNTGFLDSVDNIINAALKYKLHVIIDMHHHNLLCDDTSQYKDMFLMQWSTIARRFKDKSDSLLFEILNEPIGQLYTATAWNSFFPLALDTIRNSNPKRSIVIGGAKQGSITVLKDLIIPPKYAQDANLILTGHYYTPYGFTHQGITWSSYIDPNQKLAWYDSPGERAVIMNEFEGVANLGRPVYIGEFGLTKTDENSGARWTHFMSQFCRSKNFSFAWWGFSSLYDYKKNEYDNVRLNALLSKDEWPPFAVYGSDFSWTTLNSWKLKTMPGTSATLSNAEFHRLKLETSNSGANSSDVQIYRDGISIKAGKYYLVQFDAWDLTDMETIINGEMGSAFEPNTKYSTGNTFKITNTQSTYSYVFQSMVTDANARIIFNAGNTGSSTLFFNSVAVMEIPQSTYESNFTNGSDGWEFYKNTNDGADGSISFEDGKMKIVTTAEGISSSSLQAFKNNIPVQNGKDYLVSFNAFSTANKKISHGIMQNSGSFYGAADFDISTTDSKYRYLFKSNENNLSARQIFNLGKSGTSTISFYNINISEVILNKLYESNFANSGLDGWRFYSQNNGSASINATSDFWLQVITTNPGDYYYSIQVYKNDGFKFQSGQLYSISFEASGMVDKTIQLGVMKATSPHNTYLMKKIYIKPDKQFYNLTFMANFNDDDGRIMFNLGASGTSGIKIRNIALQRVY